jgi:hypothetical protein
MARPPAPKLSVAARGRQVLAGITAFASVTALFFVVLRWRADTPKEHLNFGGIVLGKSAGQNDE